MTGGVVIDANLLCLLTVGRIDIASIKNHPRVCAFDSDDFDMLVAAINRLGDPVLCPHVLAETSNLLAYRQSSSQSARWLTSLADIVAMTSERTEQAARVVTDDAYLRLGITDAVLLELATDVRLTLLSDDLQLCLEAERRGTKTLNYNYLRDGAVQIDQL